VNHAALNLGSAIECLYHVVLPPQVDHSPETVVSLSESDPIREFLVGVGFLKRSPKESTFSPEDGSLL